MINRAVWHCLQVEKLSRGEFEVPAALRQHFRNARRAGKLDDDEPRRSGLAGQVVRDAVNEVMRSVTRLANEGVGSAGLGCLLHEADAIWHVT